MIKNLYFIERYIQCGEMPLFLIFYKDRHGNRGHCAMIVSYKNLRSLLRKRKGFSDPAQYGRILYTSHSDEPSDSLRFMLRERYGFDFEQSPVNIPISV